MVNGIEAGNDSHYGISLYMGNALDLRTFHVPYISYVNIM